VDHRRVRWVLAAVVAGCGGPSTPPTEAPAAEAPPPSEPTSCQHVFLDGVEEWDLSPDGLVTRVYANSDAAGSQWREEYEYDARGRRRLIEAERLEGMGEVGPMPPIEPTYLDDPEAHSVEVRFGAAYWDAPRVVWRYDVGGRPIRMDAYDGGDEPARSVECAFDGRGRVIRRGSTRFDYRGEDSVPSAMAVSEAEVFVVRADGEHIAVRLADPGEPREYEDELFEGEADLSGNCIDVLMRPCSPIFAPPPPGRDRATLPRP